jgi:hypothetical protein
MKQPGGKLSSGGMKVLVAGLALTLSGQVPATGPNKEAYELSERCGKTARDWFARDWGDGVSGKIISTYRNHYSEKLNKCFVLLSTTQVTRSKTCGTLVMATLFDVNESNDYGHMSSCDQRVTVCNVHGQDCASAADWQMLLRPYLDE